MWSGNAVEFLHEFGAELPIAVACKPHVGYLRTNLAMQIIPRCTYRLEMVFLDHPQMITVNSSMEYDLPFTNP